MKIGIDIVDIEDFENRVKRTGEIFLKQVFTEKELENQKTDHLAGIFAAKECLVKINIIKPGEWKKVEIGKNQLGKPFVKKTNADIFSDIEISISHSKKSAVAVAIKT